MISVYGNAAQTCEGLSRREWLRVGGLGSFGLSLAGLMAGRTAAAEPAGLTERGVPSPFGRAKSCIVLFMFGAPAHQDTWDLKPHAPSEVRGEFQPIATSVPGVHACEHLPLLARMTDRFTQIRSVTHPDNTHTVAMHYMLTGHRHLRPKTNPQNAADDFPCFGAVMNHVRSRRSQETTIDSPSSVEGSPAMMRQLPPAVSLNAPANQVSANNHIFPGFFAGFLGHGNDPLFVSQHADRSDFAPFSTLAARDRLAGRQRLLAGFERLAGRFEDEFIARQLDDNYDRAFRLLTSPRARQAFDLDREPGELRQRYGMTPFGQGCLLARRLVESGVSLVTVNWERDDAFWDTHKNNFTDMKAKLLPNLDRGFSTLLADLKQRGLLDETLVVWLGEFGRTPRINKFAGRDHWAACNTVLLAGGGMDGGRVYGASDARASHPARNPVRPEDLSATLYYLLGIDPRMHLHKPEGQPVTLSTGEPIWDLL